LLAVDRRDDGEHLDLENSDAWALVDHQFSHVFVKDRDAQVVQQVCDLFSNSKGDAEGIQHVLAGSERGTWNLDHDRSGDVVLVSAQNSWQAYYWWLDDSNAPAFARTVDIHRKPGYDPVELFFDFETKSVPLDATLIKGSHGVVPLGDDAGQGVLLSSVANVFRDEVIFDTAICDLVMGLLD
jgi:hypothetical protein